jgi:uncharacterized protein (TIGR00266 family)
MQYEQGFSFQPQQEIKQDAVLRGVVSGRPMFGSVDVYLQNGQEVVADGGTLLWMDSSLTMSTGMAAGGCMSGIARECAGESCCLNTYKGDGKVGLGTTLPGDVMTFAVTPESGWVLSKGSYIAGSNNLKVSARFAGCCACLFSGEGPFLTRVTTQDPYGMFYAGGYGAITRHDIPAGQVFLVDNGLFFAANDKQKISITIVAGARGCWSSCKTAVYSGEGLVMRFYGPCVIFTQSRDPAIFDPVDKRPPAGENGF